MSTLSSFRTGRLPYEKPMYGCLLNPYHPLAYGLVGCWLCNEGGGNTVFDLSGKQNHGTLGGGTAGYCPSWIAGRTNTALDFDGTDDYVNCGNDESLNITGHISVVARINPDSFGIENNMLNKVSDDSNSNQGFWLGSDDSARPFFYSRVDLVYYGVTSPVSLSTGNWYHIVGIYDGTRKIYVDGVLKSTSESQPAPPSDSGNLEFGKRSNVQNSYRFDGKIAEVCIYNRALSASEIQQLYADPYCMFYHPLEAELLYAVGGATLNLICNLQFGRGFKFNIIETFRNLLRLDASTAILNSIAVSRKATLDSILLENYWLSLVQKLIAGEFISYDIWRAPPHIAPSTKKVVNADNYNAPLLIWDASKATSLNLIKQLNLFDSYIIEAGVEHLLSLIKSSNLFDSYSLDVEQFIKKSIKSKTQSKIDYSLNSSTVVSLIQLSLINNTFQMVQSLNLSDIEKQKLIQLFTDGLLLSKHFTLEEIYAGILTLIKGLKLDDSYRFEIKQKLKRIIQLKDNYTIQEIISGFLSLTKTLNLDDSYILELETQLRNLLALTEKSKLTDRLQLTDNLVPQPLTQFNYDFQSSQKLNVNINILMNYGLTETEAITLNSLFTIYRVTALTLMKSLSLHDSTVIAILMILTKQMTLAEAIELVSTVTAVPIKEIITVLKKILVSTSLKEIGFSSSKIWQS